MSAEIVEILFYLQVSGISICTALQFRRQRQPASLTLTELNVLGPHSSDGLVWVMKCWLNLSPVFWFATRFKRTHFLSLKCTDKGKKTEKDFVPNTSIKVWSNMQYAIYIGPQLLRNISLFGQNFKGFSRLYLDESLKTIQLLPPILSDFWGGKCCCFVPKCLGLPVLQNNLSRNVCLIPEVSLNYFF